MLRSFGSILRSGTSTRMLSTSPDRLQRIAVCQITSTNDKESNFEKCAQLISQAKSNGAKMAFLPECVDFVGEKKEQAFDLAEPLDGPLMEKYKALAAKSNIWLSLGSLHIRDPDPDVKKIHNSHVVIDDQGRVAATYDKVHLFDVDIPTFRIKESDFAIAGDSLKAPVESPVGKIGLAICYDMRFPELALSLAKSGAELLTYPSAFTVATGYAHWEALLRARAIETQCYVVAAAQVGQHNAKRSSYGHSLVIDPWGAVIAQASDVKDHVIYADINTEYLAKVRQGMPVWNHRRPDIYGDLPAVAENASIDDQETYPFGQFTLCKSQLFYRTPLTMAFVNKMPVLNGHVLVTPIRVASRLKDLSPAERADLISVVKKVQSVVEIEFKTDSSSVNIQVKFGTPPGDVLVSPLRRTAVRLRDLNNDELIDLMTVVARVQSAIEKEYKAQDSTISLQDGVLAGRSVDHLHVHILPRHVGDFKNDNDVYAELQDPAPKKRVRSAEEMAEEATRLRKYFS